MWGLGITYHNGIGYPITEVLYNLKEHRLELDIIDYYSSAKRDNPNPKFLDRLINNLYMR